MAYNDSHDMNSRLSLVLDVKTLLTNEGYRKLFEKCENVYDIFSRQRDLYNQYDFIKWIDALSFLNHYSVIEPLIVFPKKLFPGNTPLQHDDCVTLIQFYSLMENIFRNTLLHPYIPAYRTINKNCGRYCSFFRRYETKLPFRELRFDTFNSNLLTYTGNDQQKTIIYALTCSILYHYYQRELEFLIKDQAEPKRRQHGN
ncbi:hypothetical protein I4U23_026805 [Adineta vaga]|nr:hypothetical protein I4U23_026805 [Adineta vaga]